MGNDLTILVITLGLALLAKAALDMRRVRRRHRQRDDLRHVLGARQWWGQR